MVFEVLDPRVVLTTIGDFIWDDINQNGLQEVGEPGISDVELDLVDVNGTILDSALSGANGEYSFSIDRTALSDSTLVAYYSFDASSGDVVNDSSPIGQDNSATLEEDARFDPSGQGGAVRLDGNGDYVDVVDTADINAATISDLSIGLWFKADNVQTARPQVLYEQGGTTRGINVYIQDGLLYVGAWDQGISDWGGSYPATSPGQLSSGNWHHVTLVLNGSGTLADDALQGYLDGNEFGSAPATRSRFHRGDIGIGRIDGRSVLHTGVADAGNSGFAGLIDEFRFYQQALTSEEVRTLVDQSVQVEISADNFFGGALAGYRLSSGDVGADDSLDSDFDALGRSTIIDATTSNDQLDFDAGAHFAPIGTLGDRVWLDENANGIQDNDEAGIANVNLELLDLEGHVLATTNTNSDGIYRFVLPGPREVDDSGLVAHYTFDDGSGNVVADTSPFGSDNSASLTGGNIWVDSDRGGALQLDGVNDAIVVPDSGDINAMTVDDLTISLWFNADDVNNSSHQVLYEQGGSSRGLNIYLHAGSLYVGQWNSDYQAGWAGSFVATVPGEIESGVWHHVVLRLDGDRTLTPESLKGFLDGVEFGTANGLSSIRHVGDISLGSIAGQSRFHDGVSSSNSGRFAGRLDEFRFYQRTLLASEISTLAESANNYIVQLPVGNFTNGGALAGYTLSPVGAGLDPSLDSDFGVNRRTSALSIVDGELRDDIDAGVFLNDETSSHVGSQVWNDLNQNGIREAEEPGIADVQLSLIDANGNTVGSTQTDTLGNYSISVPAFEPVLPSSDLVTYFSFNESTGNVANDTAPSGIDDSSPLLANATWTTSGQQDSALQLNGINAYVGVPDTPDMNGSTLDELTISLWFSVDDISIADRKQVIYEQGGSNRGLNVYVHDGRLYAGVWNDDAQWEGVFFSTDQIADSTWHHFAIVLNGNRAASIGRVYLDGSEFAAADTSPWYSRHLGDIGIGRADGTTQFHDGIPPANGNGFKGAIDEFRFYHRRLSADEVSTLAGNTQLISVQIELVNFEAGGPLDGFVMAPRNIGNAEEADSDFDISTADTGFIGLPPGVVWDFLDAGLFSANGSDVSGTVYQDQNANGIDDDNSGGAANWTVRNYIPEQTSILSTAQLFTQPQDILVEPSGDFIVSDPHRQSLFRVNSSTGEQTLLTVLSRPMAIARNADGNIIVADANLRSVIEFDEQVGNYSIIHGGLQEPRGVAIDGDGNILVTTKNSRQLLRIDPNSSALEVVASDLSFPEHLTVGADGQIYVVERSINQVTRFDPVSGSGTAVAAGGLLDDPWGISFGPDGDLYVTSHGNSSIVRIDPETGAQSFVAVGGNLITPHGITFDASGDLYLVDGTAPIGAGSLIAVQERVSLDETRTSPTGLYQFNNVPSGDSVVEAIPATGWSPSSNNPVAISFTSGNTIANVDFGAFENIDIRGVKFDDANGNGSFDNGESRQPDWTVFVDTNENGAWDIEEPIATTDALGAFTIEGLGPGNFSILTRQKVGWTQTTPAISIEVDNSGQDINGVNIGSSFDSSATRPNVLMLSIDDLNNWIAPLGRYGGTVHTPNLNALLARGAMFDDAHVPSVECDPSRSAIMTGLSARNVGILTNGPHWQYTAPDAVSLPAYFRQNGYNTVGISKSFHQVNPIDGDAVAWDVSHVSGAAYSPDENDSTTALGTFPLFGSADAEDGEFRDAVTADTAASYLSGNFDDPFFMAVGFIKPHAKWIVPQEYFDLYPLDEIVLPTTPANDLDDIPQYALDNITFNGAVHDLVTGADKWAELIQSYLASASFMDAQLGKVVDALDASPYADNTIITVWSDHGYHLGEKDHWHKYTLWEESTHIPFGIVAPGITQANQIVGDVVDVLDIYPTLLDLAGLPASSAVEGASLRPLLDQSVTDDGRPAVTSSLDGDAVRTNEWRYIRYVDGSEELYDIVNDREQYTNLAGDPIYDSVIAQLQVFLPGAPAAALIGVGGPDSDPNQNSSPGDSNGDGQFDSLDLIMAFSSGEYEDDIANNSSFSEGDWNADGDFNSNDLILAFQTGGYVFAAVSVSFDVAGSDWINSRWDVQQQQPIANHNTNAGSEDPTQQDRKTKKSPIQLQTPAIARGLESSFSKVAQRRLRVEPNEVDEILQDDDFLA